MNARSRPTPAIQATRVSREASKLESIPSSLSHIAVAWHVQHLDDAIRARLTTPGKGNLMWFPRGSPWHHTVAVARAPDTG